jgi:flagellum-specific ATP synthase
MPLNLKSEINRVNEWSGLQPSGRVTQIVGLLIESAGPNVHLGELCTIYNRKGDPVPCEVVGFKEDKVLLMCLGSLTQIAPGAEVCPSGEVPMVAVSMALCGRVIDALGRPLDGKGPISVNQYYPLEAPPPKALQRRRINKQFHTGVRALDGTCSAAYGQRFGIFAGAGVGKSTLLSMVAKMSEADINVIALIGERGREVREFIERDLGPEGMARSVVIVVTSDEPALLRVKGAATATAIAEYFRDHGKDVVLMMDSVTRYAMALREIGLAVGEPPTTKGYTPSVFAALPKLLERAGNSDRGSITGVYTILVEGDDLNDPVADTVRSILDGHIVLSRKLASANHYPAIDVLGSLSRVMKEVVDSNSVELAASLRELLQTYTEAEDLINIGAYTAGSNPAIDAAIAHIDSIRGFLRQGHDERISAGELWDQLRKAVR